MGRTAVGSLLLLGACSPGPLRLPEVEGATSVAVVVQREPRTIAIAAYGPTAAALELSLQTADDPITALYYGPDVVLPYGLLTENTADLWSRPLPAPLHVEAHAGADAAWQQVDPMDLDPVLLPFESPITCAARGGCFADADAWTCTAPCPPPPEVTPPEAPRPPVFAPCPPGWTEDVALHACLAPIAACPAGQLQLPGDPACRAPGPACSDEWALGLDDATTLFVRAGAVGGDGTRARPFATISEATPAAVIALARGDHALPARATGRIVGACAAQTRLVSSTTVALDGAAIEAVSIDAPLMRLSGDVRLSGVLSRGAIVTSGALRLDDVKAIGQLSVETGARLIARDVALGNDDTVLALARTTSVTIERAELTGAIVVDAGALTLRSSTLRASLRPALLLQGATATLERVDVGVTGASFAMEVRGLSALEVRRAWVSTDGDIAQVGEGGSASFLDASLRGGGRVEGGCIGGADVKIALERVQIEGCRGYAVQVLGPASEVSVRDLVSTARGTLEIGARPPIVVQRVRGDGSANIRLLVAGSTYPWGLELEDVTLHGGRLRIRDAGQARVERLHIIDGTGAGIQTEIASDVPHVDASDIRIEGLAVDPDCQNRGCIGAAVLTQGSVTVDRFYFANNPGPGLQVQYSERRSALRNGVIADQQTGVALYGAPTDLRPLLEGVTLRSVSQVCEPCGATTPP